MQDIRDAREPGGPQTRRGKLAVGAAAVVFGLVVAAGVAVLYDRYGNADATPQVRVYLVESDTAVRLSFTVTKDPGRAAACLVRSRSDDFGEAGHDVVAVPKSRDGARVVLVEHVLRTTKRAVTAEVVRCKTLEPGEALPAHPRPAAPGQPHH